MPDDHDSPRRDGVHRPNMLWGVTPLDEADMEAVLRLLPQHRDRILELGALAANVSLNSGLPAAIWRHTGDLDEADSAQLCSDLTNLTVLSSDADTLRLNAFAGAWLRGHANRSHSAAVDTALLKLAAEQADGDQWWRLPADQTYLWSALTTHLRRVGRDAEATALVGDLRWTVGQILACGVGTAEAELAAADTHWARRLAAELAANTSQLTVARDWELGKGHCRAIGGALASRLRDIPELSTMLNEFIGASAGEIPLLARQAPPRPAPLPTRGFAAGWGVHGLAIARDGSWLASAGQHLKIWDLATGIRHCDLESAESLIAIAENQSWLATSHSGDSNARFHITDLGTGVTLATGDLGFSAAFGVEGCVIDDTWFAAAPPPFSRTSGSVWEIATGRRLSRLPIGCRSPTALGSQLLVETASEILLLDPRIGRIRQRHPGELVDFWHPRTGTQPDPENVVAGFCDRRPQPTPFAGPGWTAVRGQDDGIVVRDADSGHRRFALANPGAHLATDPHGAWFAWRDADSVTVRDTSDGSVIAALAHPAAVVNGSVSDDGSTLAVILDNGNAQIWDTERWWPRGTPAAGKIRRFLLAPNGSWLATFEHRHTHIWDTATGEHRMELPETREWLATPDSRRFIAETDMHGSLEVWDVSTPPSAPAETGQLTFEPLPPAAGGNGGTDLAVPPDEPRFMIEEDNDSFHVRDKQTGELILNIEKPDLGTTDNVLVAPDGSWVAEAGWHWTQNGRRLYLGRLIPGEPASVDWGPDLNEWPLEISPDSRWITTQDWPTRLSIWEAATSRVVAIVWLDLPLRHCTWLPGSDGIEVEFCDGQRRVFDFTPPPGHAGKQATGH